MSNKPTMATGSNEMGPTIKIPMINTRSQDGLRFGNVAKQKYKDLSHRYQWRFSKGTAETEAGMVITVCSQEKA